MTNMSFDKTLKASPVWIALIGLLALTAGCGPGAKGQSLLELEALRASNYSRTIRISPDEVDHPRLQEMRTLAVGTIAESDQWYNASIDAWESARDEESEEFARQGVLLYRGAEAYSRSADARERIEQANASYQLQLERRNRYNDMIRANEEVIMLLRALQELYEQTSDCRAGMAAASAEGQAREAAALNLLDAQAAKREAENNGANGFAESVFNEGVRQLAEALGYNDSEQYQLAADTATAAHSRFREAILQSQTEIQDLRRGLLRRSANEDLFEEAISLFGDNAQMDGRGLVVVVPNLFPERRSDIRTDNTYVLDQVAGLLRDNRRFSVLIEGHTADSGNADANSAISRARAEAVRDYLIQHDIRSRRLSTESFGEAYPRYDNRDRVGQTNNNRVEFVFPFED